MILNVGARHASPASLRCLSGENRRRSLSKQRKAFPSRGSLPSEVRGRLLRVKPSPAYRGWHGTSRVGCGGEPVRYSDCSERRYTPHPSWAKAHDTFSPGRRLTPPPFLRMKFQRIGACRRPYKQNRGCVPPLIRHAPAGANQKETIEQEGIL